MFIYFALLCAFTSAMQDDQNNALLDDQGNEMQNLENQQNLNLCQQKCQQIMPSSAWARPYDETKQPIALKDPSTGVIGCCLSLTLLICVAIILARLENWKSTVNMADVCVLHQECFLANNYCLHSGDSAIPPVAKYFMTTAAASAPFCLYTYDATNYCVKFTKKSVGQLVKWVKNECKSWGYSCPEKCGWGKCDVNNRLYAYCQTSVVKYIDDANRLSGENKSILEHCKTDTCAEASAYYGENNEPGEENLVHTTNEETEGFAEELFKQIENIEK